MTRYPSHNGTHLYAVPDLPKGSALYVRDVVTCVAPLLPPECVGLDRYTLAASAGQLFCANCRLVDATPEQIEQARQAAREDGTWPATAATPGAGEGR